MNVGELIEQLKRFDPEVEAHIFTDDFSMWDSSEIMEVYESDATYGIATPKPTTVRTVVMK